MPGHNRNYRMVFATGGSLTLRVPEGRSSLADLMPQFHLVFDQIITREINGLAVSCGPGCATCCRQLIPISLPEAFFLRDRLHRLPPKKRKRVKHRAFEIMEKATEAGLMDGISNPRENQEVDTAFFRLGLPCPFLENNSCGIYEHRPLSCREYLVTSDKQFCRQPESDRVARIRIERNMAVMLAVFASHIYQVPKYPIPLFSFIEYTDRFKRLGEMKWPAQEIFDRFLGGLQRLNDEHLSLSIRVDENGT